MALNLTNIKEAINAKYATEIGDDDKVELLLQDNGTTFYDASLNRVDVVGDYAKLSATQAKWGTHSIEYTAGNGYIDLPTVDFAFGTGDFTVEFWMYGDQQDGNIINPISSTGAGYWAILIQTGKLRWNDAYATTNLLETTVDVTAASWKHFAFVRSSGTLTVYVDGTANASIADTSNYVNSDARIGNGNVGQLADIYFDDIRVTKGKALYTSNFTAPTSQFTISSDLKLLNIRNQVQADENVLSYASINDFPTASPTNAGQILKTGNNYYVSTGIGYDAFGLLDSALDQSPRLRFQGEQEGIQLYPNGSQYMRVLFASDTMGAVTPIDNSVGENTNYNQPNAVKFTDTLDNNGFVIYGDIAGIKFPFANSVSVITSWTKSDSPQRIVNGGGASDVQNGYGWSATSQNPPTIPQVPNIYRFPYTSYIPVADLVGNMPSPRARVDASTGSDTVNGYGYWCHGFLGNPPPNVNNISNFVDKIPFTSGTPVTGSPTTNMNHSTYDAGAASSEEYVFTFAGIAPTPGTINTISKLAFSAGNASSDHGDLTTAANQVCGSSGKTDAYAFYGPPSSSNVKVDKFPYASNVGSTTVIPNSGNSKGENGVAFQF